MKTLADINYSAIQQNTFGIFQIIFAYLFRQVQSYDKEVITRLFSYWLMCQAYSQQLPSAMPRAVVDAQADVRANMKPAL